MIILPTLFGETSYMNILYTSVSNGSLYAPLYDLTFRRVIEWV